MSNSTALGLKQFGYLFYLVTPQESTFNDLEKVPKYLNQVTPWFIITLLIELAILIYKKKVAVSDSITSVSQGIFQETIQILLKFGAGISVYVWIYENWRLVDIPSDSVFAWACCLLAVDFGYYWFHRASHEIHFAWAAHQVHHSSEEYNLSTALRQSVIQDFLGWTVYLPIAFFIPPPIYAVHIQFNLIYQFWIHTEFIKTLGPLEYIINTPSHHRVHHGRNRYCIDKNYAGVLIIWDRMFGTFEAESDKVVYGLTHPINTFNSIKIQFDHYLYLWDTFWKAEGIKNKLSVLLKGPGWEPGKPRLGNLEDIPDVSYPVEKYFLQLEVWCNVYIIAHFALTIIGYIIVANNHQVCLI
ncbi:alkylglycerol monooxygenase-like [Centruroides sculpturatus]|uniref:alkylglycerol monooxygenase-like n=1 Tax=Centruroides sculpturatus TaxID=218467 RepID=UPI000C6D926B|nr:alkylglycerol monooxygenase-like [Centruroides sculpturatus]XP_023237980.1 alkylglycerol monooxygenase-like [Centruroides sculpturatus]XP_023238047.1 alkylglycerol monooxygenase-like [Centruroides sculpturatus]